MLQPEVQLVERRAGLGVEQAVADLVQQHHAEQAGDERRQDQRRGGHAELQRSTPPMQRTGRQVADDALHGGPAL
jgi:hypothetical protein